MPSAHNIQPWSFVVVKKPETIDKLMQACFYGRFHGSPNILIAVVLEPVSEEHQGLLKGTAKEVTEYHQYIHIGLPVLAMTLEAEALGIASCIVSPDVKEANRILGVPNDRKTVLLTGLGYEKEGAFQHPRHRKELKEMVHYGVYGSRTWTAMQ